MLSEILLEAGYDTAVFAGNPWLDSHAGLGRGFGHIVPSWRGALFDKAFLVSYVRDRLVGRDAGKGALESNAAFKAWLEDQRAGGRPFFALVNYLEPHMPYHQVPAEDRGRFLPAGTTLEDATAASNRFAGLMIGATQGRPDARERAIAEALYDGGIANADRRFGELIDVLRRDGRLDDTLVIVTADHGELFGEHEIYGHDLGLYHPLLHVPLVMRLPGKIPAGARTDAPVHLVDLFPTVLELVGLGDRKPPDVSGHSLRPLIAGEASPHRPVFAEYTTPTLPWAVSAIRRMGFDPTTYDLESVQLGDLRLIRGPRSLERLFDRAKDPEETTDVAAERPAELAALRALLDKFTQNSGASSAPQEGARPEMDAATREQLRALGYLQ